MSLQKCSVCKLDFDEENIIEFSEGLKYEKDKDVSQNTGNHNLEYYKYTLSEPYFLCQTCDNNSLKIQY